MQQRLTYCHACAGGLLERQLLLSVLLQAVKRIYQGCKVVAVDRVACLQPTIRKPLWFIMSINYGISFIGMHAP